MAIFLHFLNREAYRAVDAAFSLSEVSCWLRILTIGTAEPLITNFANLLEGGYLSSREATLFRGLLSHDQLLIAGERPSLAEFLDSRRLRYGFDAARYPMYFSGGAAGELRPAYIRTLSATDYLESKIDKLTRRDVGLSEMITHAPDRLLVNEALPALNRIINERDSSAITRSLFSGRVGSTSHEAATSRLISSLYIQQHLEEFGCDITTGLRPLLAFEALGSGDHSHDIALLYAVLSASGITRNTFIQQANDELLVGLRGSRRHESFVRRLTLFSRALGNHAARKHSGRAARHYARSMLNAGSAPNDIVIAQSIYEQADLELARVAKRLQSVDKAFAEEYEREIAGAHKGLLVLLVTATKVETQALLRVADEQTRNQARYIRRERYIAAELGYLNGARLITVQCEPGSVGPSSAQAVITEAIADFRPQAVILVGIAFGTKPDKQRLGDVLVSKVVTEYERAKRKEGVSIPRGQRLEAAPKLISLFRATEAIWRDVPVHVGLLLSGEKLVDDKAFVTELLKVEPEAIGGEMEGAGLVAAAERAKVDWIMAKAIVDWGYEKSTSNSEDQQYEAARSACRFVFAALSNIGL